MIRVIGLILLVCGSLNASASDFDREAVNVLLEQEYSAKLFKSGQNNEDDSNDIWTSDENLSEIIGSYMNYAEHAEIQPEGVTVEPEFAFSCKDGSGTAGTSYFSCQLRLKFLAPLRSGSGSILNPPRHLLIDFVIEMNAEGKKSLYRNQAFLQNIPL